MSIAAEHCRKPFPQPKVENDHANNLEKYKTHALAALKFLQTWKPIPPDQLPTKQENRSKYSKDWFMMILLQYEDLNKANFFTDLPETNPIRDTYKKAILNLKEKKAIEPADIEMGNQAIIFLLQLLEPVAAAAA